MENRAVRQSMKPARPALFRLGRLVRASAPLARGVVSLVGAGPGDPGLLTLKAARRLSEADVVFYDALVSDAVLALCRPGIRLVPVGKRRGVVTMAQDDIVVALAREAVRGLAVVRLKGGDPFVFGRGGEEALGLLEHGVPFEIVPGVTSGVAAPALAGIPVTHRGVSSSVAFVTAHDLGSTDAGERVRERLIHLAQGADTLVIFMAGGTLAGVREALLHAGLSGETPAAVIESGSTPRERAAAGTLDGLVSLRATAASGPVLVVIGNSVGLRERLREAPRREDTVSAHG